MTERIIYKERLALWFAGPAVLSEFGPNSPTDHEAFPAPLTRLRDVDQSGCSITEALDRELDIISANHQRIAVLLSGGLDSAAILHRLSTIISSKRITAVVADLTDDQGRSSANAAARLAHAIDPAIDIVIANPHRDQPVEWSPVAPRLDAAPRHNDSLIRAALDHGCTIALTGNGGDELFASPRFLMGRMLRRRQGRKLVSYLGDTVLYSWEAALKEPIGMMASLFPPTIMRSTYDRIVWPEDRITIYRAINELWHDAIWSWSRRWRAQLVLESAQCETWAELDAWGNIFPLVPPHYPQNLEMRHPFLSPHVIAAGLSQPLESRYDEQQPNAYWRTKASVLSLFAPHIVESLPRAKQVFNRTVTEIQAIKAPPQALIEAGILKSDIDWEKEPDIFQARVGSVETWLAEALSRGYTLS